MTVTLSSRETTSVFVYGTLKRGQCRARCWPREPRRVRAGWVRGCLYGRADYPAMTEGSDRVLGELWEFSTAEIAAVLTTLDQIEGANQPGCDDLYRRLTTPVWDLSGEWLGAAWTYHYASSPQADGFLPIRGADLVCWPATS